MVPLSAAETATLLGGAGAARALQQQRATFPAEKELSSEMENNEEGLRQLGLRRDSGKSVLHLWARQLPSGRLDGHRSGMVAPDHLLYHGLTKRLVTGAFRLLNVSQRVRVGLSLREALARSHFPTTTIYNEKRNSIVAVGISEWAAALPDLGFEVRRTLRSASSGAGPDAVMTPLHRGLKIVDAYAALVCAAYYFPHVELDGAVACRSRITPRELQLRAEVFFVLVQEACLRADLKAFGMRLDVPNLHRLRELVDHVIPALLHVHHTQELLFENAHQPLKRGVVTGNGHEDSTRALSRYRQAELAARLRLEPSVFLVPDDWTLHAGVRACLSRARSLWSEDGGRWRCSGGALDASQLPDVARRIAASRTARGSVVKWRARATPGSASGLQAGDAISVLVSLAPGLEAVNVAQDREAYSQDAKPSFFRAVAFFVTSAGTASAMVQPLVLHENGRHWSLNPERYLFLPLINARRALLLHDCACECVQRSSLIVHKPSNRWAVFGRRSGYPSRSGLRGLR